MQLAGREPAQLGGDLARADPRGVQQRLAVDQRHGGRAGGGQRAAALGVEPRGARGRPSTRTETRIRSPHTAPPAAP